MIRFYRPPRPTWGWLEVYGAIGVALLFVARFVPLAKLPFWGCTLRRHTGMPCLSCGMTRSFDWFLRGRFLDSLLINPVGFVLAVLSVVGLLYFVLSPLRPPRLELRVSARTTVLLRIGAVAALLLNWSYLVIRTLVTGA